MEANWFRMRNTSTGEEHYLRVEPKNSTIYAAFGSPAMRSSLWKVDVRVRNHEVYLLNRDLGHRWKISLHRTGQWHIKVLPATPPVADIRIHEWARPDEIGDVLTFGLDILAAAEDLSPRSDDPPAGVQWLPQPPDGHAGVLNLSFLRATGTNVTMNGRTPMGAWWTRPDEALVLSWIVKGMSEEDRRGAAKHRKGLAAKMAPGPGRTARALVGTVSREGNQCLLDLAVRSPE